VPDTVDDVEVTVSAANTLMDSNSIVQIMIQCI